MKAKNGDTVQIHYTGTLDDGTTFDSSVGRAPLEFTIGARQVIPGFERPVIGMAVGESCQVHIEPADAYGERRDDLVIAIPRSDVPDHIEIEPGLKLQLRQPSGRPLVVTVTDVTDETVTLDGNHELAGQALNFAIELVAIL